MFFMNSGLHQTILAVFIDTQFNNEDMQEIFFFVLIIPTSYLSIYCL